MLINEQLLLGVFLCERFYPLLLLLDSLVSKNYGFGHNFFRGVLCRRMNITSVLADGWNHFRSDPLTEGASFRLATIENDIVQTILVDVSVVLRPP